MWRCWLILFLLLVSTFEVRAGSFFVTKGGQSQTGLTLGVDTLVSFDTEVFDSDSEFANSRFTPKVAGPYLLSGSVGWLSLDTGVLGRVSIYKNGSMAFMGRVMPGGVGVSGNTVVGVVWANGSSDFFEVYGSVGGTTARDISGVESVTFFAGSLLSGGGVMSALGLTDNELLSVLMIAALLLIYAIGFGVGQQR